MSGSNKDNWDALIEAALMEQLDEAGFDELQAAMLEDRELRDRYRAAARLDVACRDLADGGLVEPSEPESVSSLPLLPAWSGRVLSAAVILLLVTVCTGLLIERQQFQRGEPFENVSINGVAILTHSVSAKFAGRSPVTSEMIPSGPFVMSSGLVQLELNSGVLLLAEGQVELELVDGMRVKCSRGLLRFHVPPHAKGFVLETPFGEVVDLGTEYGVAVDEAGLQLKVFDGSVLWRDPNGIEETYKAGDRFKTSGVKDIATVIYPKPAQLREADYAHLLSQAQRWRDTIARLREDDSLKVMFHPTYTKGWGRTIENLAKDATPTSNGAVIGARWADGRFPGAESLEFKRDGDRIRFEEHGTYDQITMIIWVRIDGFNHKHNSLMLSDHWTSGDTHWHFGRDGRLVFGIRRDGPRGMIYYDTEPLLNSSHLGRWIQLAVTYDGKQAKGAHYLNGQQVLMHDVLKPYPATIGQAAISNWTSGDKDYLRTLNGRVDFFAYFSRALSPDEIKVIYENGRNE